MAVNTLHSTKTPGGRRRRIGPFLGLALLLAATGCRSGLNAGFFTRDVFHVDRWTMANLTKPNVELPTPPQDVVYRAGHWSQESPPLPGTLAGDYASAKVLYDRGDHADAEAVFNWIYKRALKEKNTDVMEDCLFMEAECQYAQRCYPRARETYQKLLTDFPSSRYRNEAVQRQFTIAEYWLDDTREAMKAAKENEGKLYFRVPTFVHFAKEKPTFDLEGHAVKTCEDVFVQDPGGPLAPHALYRAGGVSFFRENFEEADAYYSMLVDQYPKSSLAAPALELAIQSKVMQAGGAAYDGRKLIEARRLTETALRSYPELREKREFLERTLLSINEQQAEKDFTVAEFYRRTGHPGAAYFYYEVVRRRYAGSGWADKAVQRMNEIRTQVETEAPHENVLQNLANNVLR